MMLSREQVEFIQGCLTMACVAGQLPRDALEAMMPVFENDAAIRERVQELERQRGACEVCWTVSWEPIERREEADGVNVSGTEHLARCEYCWMRQVFESKLATLATVSQQYVDELATARARVSDLETQVMQYESTDAILATKLRSLEARLADIQDRHDIVVEQEKLQAASVTSLTTAHDRLTHEVHKWQQKFAYSDNTLCALQKAHQQAVEALAGVTGKLERLQQFVDSGQLMKNYRALAHAAKFIATQVHEYGMQTEQDELDLTTAEFTEVWRGAKRLLALLAQGEVGHE